MQRLIYSTFLAVKVSDLITAARCASFLPLQLSHYNNHAQHVFYFVFFLQF